MDALDLLEEQHRELDALLSLVGSADSPGRRTALVARLVQAVDAHSWVERSVFYSAFAERVGTDWERLYDAFEDHSLMRFTATNLLSTRATDVRFAVRLKRFEKYVRHHASVEEDWLFPKAKRALPDEVLDRIGVEIARAYRARTVVRPLRAVGPSATGPRERGWRSGKDVWDPG